MDKISEGIFTTGNSFRAIAEARARSYRISELYLPKFDKYGHKLTEDAGKRGMNYLPSLRYEIMSAVVERKRKGKGLDIPRTTQNMLSSQAMCFNLFVPLNLDKKFAAAFFKELLGDCAEIIEPIEIEYTPSKTIFRDQSGKGGVDCDALLKYKNSNGGNSLVVIETKFVEEEFSNCGFRKSNQKDPCPIDTLVTPEFNNCRYHYKKHNDYWKIAKESDLFDMHYLHNNPCPFGGGLWQLWVNMSLAWALAEEMQYDDFSYAVICHEDNVKLTNGGQVFHDFRKLLKNPDKLRVIYLQDVKKVLEKIKTDHPNHFWTEEFINRYCF